MFIFPIFDYVHTLLTYIYYVIVFEILGHLCRKSNTHEMYIRYVHCLQANALASATSNVQCYAL